MQTRYSLKNPEKNISVSKDNEQHIDNNTKCLLHTCVSYWHKRMTSERSCDITD